MSRPIKFRAWDGEKVLSQHGEVMGMVRGKSLVISVHAIDNEQEGETYVHNRDLVLMQFTGLTDKNGKEIYEGDVVRQAGKTNTANKKVVAYRGTKKNGIGFNVSETSTGRASCEVIGNTYENPNLLSV